MRRIIYGALFLLTIQHAHSQDYDLDEFNKYKYISVETLIDKRKDRVDPWGVSTYLRFRLIKLGFVVIDDRKDSWKEEAQFNQCLVVSCDITDNTKKIGRNRVELFFFNCHGDTLFHNKGSGYEETERKSYQAAVDRALEPMQGIEYSFKPDLALGPVLPEVETNTDSESELKTYFDSDTRDKVEGIYSFNNKYSYRIGIKKEGEGYEGAVLGSDAPYWNDFEVKIYLDHSLLGEDVFNITWLNDVKEKSETVGKIVEGNLLMEIKKDTERETIKLIKEYPKIEIDK